MDLIHSMKPNQNMNHPEPARLQLLKKESTISLIQRIAEDSDVLALKVFHETRNSFYRNGRWVRLVEFIRALKDGRLQEDENQSSHISMNEVLDDAYNLTLAKFYNIPAMNRDASKSQGNDESTERFTWNVDCRLYFKGLLNKIDRELMKELQISETDKESKVAMIMTRFVIKHFYLSKKECERRNKNSTRYEWKVKGKTIYLFYPSHLSAKQFREWLHENITEVDPDAPGERDRIQEIIDRACHRGENIQIDDPEFIKRYGKEDPSLSLQSEESCLCDRLSVDVAKEKSQNLSMLRPSIRSLGKEKVYELVNRIFTDLQDSKYELSRVALDFGLSKASLSRFAGSDWLKDIDNKSEKMIPDLWVNTAHVLAENPVLMETVRSAGFSEILGIILKIIGPKKGPTNE